MRKQGFLRRAEDAVDIAKKLGAPVAESYLSSAREFTVEVRDKQVETLKLADETGLGLRVLVDGKIGFSYTTDLGKDGVEAAVKEAVANAGNTAPDENRGFPRPFSEYPMLNIHDPQLSNVTKEEKINLAKSMEEDALAYDPRIKIIETSAYQDGEIEIAVCNSTGVSLTYRGTYCGVHLSLVANENEDNQTGFALDFALKYKDLDPSFVGNKAARRAVRMLGACPVKTQKVPVVFEPHVASGILGVLGPSFSGEAVQKGRSLFAGKKGQRIASDKVNIIDDGTMAGGIASSPFDGEGYPTSRSTLVQGGTLQGYLHNTYTASLEGTASTGNGTRNSFKSTPEVGTTNFFIEPGDIGPDDLLKNVGSGFYVTEVMGLHTANPISGDFSLGANGLWIENGSLAKPVKGVALAGNLVHLLKGVEEVGNDLQFFGGKGSPTIVVSEMSVSGD